MKRVFLLLILFTTGCSPILTAKTRQAQTSQAETRAAVTLTPYVAAARSATPSRVPSATPITAQGALIAADEAVPDGLVERITLASGARMANSAEEANVHIDVTHQQSGSAAWVYALVVPFPTVIDEITGDDLRDAWRGEKAEAFEGQSLMMSPSTKAAFEKVWGRSGAELELASDEDLLDQAWAKRTAFAIVPFERLEPRWKVIRIDGKSPLDRIFKLDGYPLVVNFGVTENLTEPVVQVPQTNRDPSRLTVLVMTGVTAMVRQTGNKMDTLGITYPGGDIAGWLSAADIAHISNEVSFEPDCPLANPNQTSLMFCSRPEYIGLLDYVGADVIELTGNHLIDYTRRSMPFSLDLYKEHGMQVFGSGNNLDEARQALEIEHNGNRLAFIGCNPAGPEMVWATDQRPGAADCDYEWMKAEISRLRDSGVIPIATLQYYESYTQVPNPQQVADFTALSQAGAAIVSGSQAHYPMGFGFEDGKFIHFGLGNLFFDQMRAPDNSAYRVYNQVDLPVAGTRLEFLDRHIIYDGRHISTEVLTAMLEDWSRPRPMTAEERSVFLRDTFIASGW